MLDAILRSKTFAGPLRAFLDARTPREPVRFGSAGGAFGGGDGTFSEGEGDIGRTCPLSHVRPGGSRGVHSMSRSAARALPRASRPLSGIFPFPLPAPHVGGVHILSWQVLMCSRTDPPLALSLPGPRAELHPIPSFTIYIYIYIPSSSSSAAVASLA